MHGIYTQSFNKYLLSGYSVSGIFLSIWEISENTTEIPVLRELIVGDATLNSKYSNKARENSQYWLGVMVVILIIYICFVSKASLRKYLMFIVG